MNETKKGRTLAGQELDRVRDELELKAHLAKMDAKDALAAIEPVIDEVEKKVEEAKAAMHDVKERVRLQATLGIAEMKKRLEH